MSGAFGWINNNHHHNASTVAPATTWFDDAKRAYRAPLAAAPQPVVRDLRAAAATKAQAPVPTALHTLKSAAANVIIVSLDLTGSMGQWPEEIFKRLALLWREATKYLGSEDLEILFIAHGDARTDEYPLQVTRFGHGPELDDLLASFKPVGGAGGGGQGSESSELVAYYLLKQVDTSSARHVFTFFVTDEAGCDQIAPALAKKCLGLAVDPELHRADVVMRCLNLRMNAYAILCETNCYDPAVIRQWWETHLGAEKVLPLDDARRVVDVMLASIAATTGQLESFANDMLARQGKSRFATQNVKTVLASVALIGGSKAVTPQLGKNPTRPLLPPGK